MLGGGNRGQDLPPALAATPPVLVAESRGREAECWGRGDHHSDLARGYLRPPSPERKRPGPTTTKRSASGYLGVGVSPILGGGSANRSLRERLEMIPSRRS